MEGVTTHHPTPDERDERVSIPLDFHTALRAALAVDPESEPVEEEADEET